MELKSSITIYVNKVAPRSPPPVSVLYQMQIVCDSEAALDGLFIALKRRDGTRGGRAIVISFGARGAVERRALHGRSSGLTAALR